MISRHFLSLFFLLGTVQLGASTKEQEHTISFEHLGGYCRSEDPARNHRGLYEIGCSVYEPCTIEECERKCYNKENCYGYEYSFSVRNDGVICELHETTVDSAVEADFHKHRCYKKVVKAKTPGPAPIFPPSNHGECYNYVGGLCRYNGTPKYGLYEEACRKSNPCSRSTCERKCSEDEYCYGYEYSIIHGACELHRSTIDFTEHAAYDQNRCYQKVDCENYIEKPELCGSYTCPENSEPTTSCVTKKDDCKCKPGYVWKGEKCQKEEQDCDTYSCPGNSVPIRDCVTKPQHCECKPGYFWKGDRCKKLKSYCFEYLGRFCRDEHGKSGYYTAVCSEDKPCTFEQCLSYCYEEENCSGIEYAFRERNDGVICELHTKEIVSAEGESYHSDRCYKRKPC